MKELIFVYKQAVRLHNEGSIGHVLYQDEFEKDLRQFTAKETKRDTRAAIKGWEDKDLNELNRAVMDRALNAMERAQRVLAQCEELDERVTAVLSGRSKA